VNQLALDLLQPLRPSFDNFVPGRNAEAVAAVRAAAAGRGPQFVFLWGERGCGRSHLLSSATAVASTVPQFQPGRRLYAVDDVERLNAAEQASLFNLANEIRADPQAALIAAGDRPPSRLPLREDVRTRLGWGLIYQLHPLADSDKADALRTHAASRGLALGDDLVNWLLVHLPRDMRTLVAALDALDAFALARQRALTVPLARDWMHGGPSPT
jgi:DnaA family protein